MRRSAVLFLALALAGCSKKDDAERLDKSIVSWSATLHLVAGARLGNTVRVGFAVKTADAAIEDLSAQMNSPSLPKSIALRAERVIAVAATLRRDFEDDDRPAIARAQHELTKATAESK